MKINSPPVTAINVLLLLLLLHLQLRFISSADVISDECSDRCGNITVPYPFGIGNPKCAISSSFLFNCNSSQLVFGRNIAVQNISIEEGTFSGVMLAAYRCYNETGSMDRYRFNPAIRLGTGPFRFSNVYNKLTAFGCDTLAFMTDSRGTFGSGCVSLCDDVSAAVNATSAAICAGIGCCQSSIPLGLKTLNFTVSSSKNHRGIVKWNPCDYAFLADVRVFGIGGVRLSEFPDRNPTRSSTAIEWVVEEKRCDVAKSNTTSYACRANSDCVYSENGNGYRCLCKPGFRGNPYLGCQDIDECAEPEKYPCHGKCKNTVGDYTCNCPVGMRGDGKVACQGFRVTAIVAGKNNGGMLLQHQRVRIFKESELSKATNNYDSDHFLGEGGFGHVYKGILSDDNNTPVAIKKPKGSMDKAQSINQEFQHEIAVVSQVNHINVVKVVGLCLETKLPILVYEFIANGTLFDHIHKQRSRVMSTWPQRLRIATEIAQALDYLHSLANPPIIHGDIKSTNILLDSEFRAKVSDFGASVLISPGEKPYSGSSVRTEEKINLIQYFLNSDLDKITGFWGVVEDGEMEEMEAFAEVARRCLNFSGLKRPAMKEVAEELGRLRKLKSFGYDGTEEMECLLGKSNGFASSLSFGYSEEIWVGEGEEHPPPATSQTHSVVALDMESYEIFR
ncbi:Wall-associated receptor kinase 2 [Linum perenne]